MYFSTNPQPFRRRPRPLSPFDYRMSGLAGKKAEKKAREKQAKADLAAHKAELKAQIAQATDKKTKEALKKKLDKARGGKKNAMSLVKASLNPKNVAATFKQSLTDPKQFLKDQSDLTRAVHVVTAAPGQLKAEAQMRKDLPKIMPVLTIILTIVAIFIPVIAPFVVYLRYASIAIALYQKKEDYNAAKKAQKEFDDQRKEMIATMVGQGLSQEQSTRIVDLIIAGADPEAAMRTVLGEAAVVNTLVPGDTPDPDGVAVPAPEPSAPRAPPPVPDAWASLAPLVDDGLYHASAAPGGATGIFSASAPAVASSGGNSMNAQGLALLAWIKSWKPQLYAAILAEHPEIVGSQPSQAVAGLRSDSFVDEFSYEGGQGFGSIGDGEEGFDWSGLFDTIGTVGGKLATSYFDSQTLKIQLERAKQGLAPLPTATAQKQAVAPTQAAGQPVPMVTSMGGPLVVGGIAAGAILVGWLLFGRRGRR